MTAAPQSAIEIKPWQDEDWPIAEIWLKDSWKWISDDLMPEGIDAFVGMMARQNADHFGVFIDGALCGLFTAIARTPSVLEVHCLFARRYLHPDETAEAVRAGLGLAWKIGFHKANCLVFPFNKAIIRLLARVGALAQGRLIEERVKDGKRVDMLSYALLRD